MAMPVVVWEAEVSDTLPVGGGSLSSVTGRFRSSVTVLGND